MVNFKFQKRGSKIRPTCVTPFRTWQCKSYVVSSGGPIGITCLDTPNAPARICKGVNKWINERIAKAGGTPPENWTLHDIRRTFLTRMTALKVSTDVAEALVGHVGHRLQNERTYDKYENWAEKRQALAKWEAHLRAIIDGTAEKIAHPRFGEPKKEDIA